MHYSDSPSPLELGFGDWGLGLVNLYVPRPKTDNFQLISLEMMTQSPHPLCQSNPPERIVLMGPKAFRLTTQSRQQHQKHLSSTKLRSSTKVSSPD